MEEQWINDLRKKMASHQTPVPPGLWEGIEAELAKQPPAVPSLRKKIVLWTSAVSSIAAAIALGFFFLNEEELTPAVYISQTTVTNSTSTTISTAGKAYAPKLLAQNSAPAYAVEKKSTPYAKPATSVTTEKSQTVTINHEQQNRSQIEEEPHIKEPPVVHKKQDAHQHDRNLHQSLQASVPPKRSSRVSLQLYAGNLPQATKHHSGYGELVTGSILYQSSAETEDGKALFASKIISSNKGKDVQTRKHHHLPIKIGLTARYYFNERLSIESGLTYTFLSSTLTSGTNAHHYSTHQKLQYLGLPLSVNYDLWKSRYCNIYVSAGGALEKCVRGRTDTDYVMNKRQRSTPEEKVMDHPLQCSLFGAVGAQFNLSSHIGLYAEPGVGYYFDNGSSVDNIYKEHPFNAHFKLGLRISLR